MFCCCCERAEMGAKAARSAMMAKGFMFMNVSLINGLEGS
jgi:hypothetical protein